MTSREQFEEWVTKETGFDLWRTEFPMTEWDDQQYKCHQTNLAWMAWQASRASVDVEILSEPFIAIKKDATNYDFYNAGIESAKRAITNAGIRVKDC
ncbi:hypothetical protein LDJ78_16450 [Citrobacter portucalensis]|jgi:hypothetical protein|uniref:hypothetical protein n=1 Tax=Citrobacter portucalensis TaxID=1639133 RepID=UPI001C63EC9E|nr:hypothetical protein [Citrobacter portucalensis]MEB0359594.1 hypothetical protein [Citrobacter freundii]MBW7622117.1 hypothetical protein [Citrobacter portucalensis]MBW7639778.1 hypothetical protein [Citrobacter portucalensis]MCA2134520.1 hypothetical protein [Citrobacter portucalensis]MCA2144520.1 hypothetical protein [Citrobacter portucalensis]